MRVPTVSIQTKHSTGKQAVFIHWSGESNTGGSRVTDWTAPSAANMLAATIRGALADAYHAGREAMGEAVWASWPNTSDGQDRQ